VMYDTNRILVPKNSIPTIVNLLHKGHPGQTKSRELARQLYYWPGMNNDIDQVINQCRVCQESRPQQQHFPATPTPLTTVDDSPMQNVGTDLFSHAGKDYLIMVDRYSGYPCCVELKRTNTQAIVRELSAWFNLLGWPETIRSDGGPQFRTEFDIFCEENNIIHELTAPYNPQANGLAESAVKNCKYLLIKCLETKENFQNSLAAWRAIPREDKLSPYELLFKKKPKSHLPSLKQKQNHPIAIAAKERINQRSFDYFNRKTKPLSILEPGDKVLLRHHITNKWDTDATIKERRPDNFSYVITTADNKEYIRGRRYLKTHTNVSEENVPPGTDSDSAPSQQTPYIRRSHIRRSLRLRNHSRARTLTE